MLDIPIYAYVIVTLIAAFIGCGELVARYRDAPLEVLLCPPGCLYVGVNGLVGLAGLLTIDAFELTFGEWDIAPTLILQMSMAGVGGMAVLRCAQFNVRVGGTDVHAGLYALMKIIPDAADRAVDRTRARKRALAVRGIMEGVKFNKATGNLPSYCFSLTQNVSDEERNAVAREVETLERNTNLGNKPRAHQLGLVLMNAVGEDVLRHSVEALRKEITEAE